MPVIEMFRDGEVAFVNSDHAETYENFLAHGWKEAASEAPAPAEAPAAAPAEAVESEKVEAPAPAEAQRPARKAK